jgi:zinc/manganese transport system substrate-binding protein
MMYPASVAIVRYLLLVALAALPAAPLAAAGKPTVVATFSVLSDMVANVAGDHIDLVTIVGPNGDTELYQPTLADSRTIAGARIVFVNDLNDEFEPWLEPLLKQSGFTGTKVVASRGAKTITAEEEHPISGKEAAPVRSACLARPCGTALFYVKNIAQALSEPTPPTPPITARAASYVKQLQSVDA